MKSLAILFVMLFMFNFISTAKAVVSIKPTDDAETVERINSFNKKQTETARNLFQQRVLGISDENENSDEDEVEEPTRREFKKSAAERAEKAEQLREQQAERKQERVENRCEQIEAKINNRINKYEDNADKHTSRLNAIKMKFSSMIEFLESKDCDVTTLQTLVNSLELKISDLSALYRSFIVELQGSRSLVCGESNGEFVSTVKSSNTKLAEFRSQADSISKFVKDEVKPAFKATATSCLNR